MSLITLKKLFFLFFVKFIFHGYILLHLTYSVGEKHLPDVREKENSISNEYKEGKIQLNWKLFFVF